MNITVYLPDELGQKAKDAALPFSQLLRAAVEDELINIQVTEKHLKDESAEIELNLEDEDGSYVGTFEGRKLGDVGEVSVYMKDDGAVLVYDEALGQVEEFEGLSDPDLEKHILVMFASLDGYSGYDREDFINLMRQLNITPKIAI